MLTWCTVKSYIFMFITHIKMELFLWQIKGTAWFPAQDSEGEYRNLMRQLPFYSSHIQGVS